MNVFFHVIIKPQVAILALGYLGTARNNDGNVSNDLFTNQKRISRWFIFFLLNQL